MVICESKTLTPANRCETAVPLSPQQPGTKTPTKPHPIWIVSAIAVRIKTIAHQPRDIKPSSLKIQPQTIEELEQELGIEQEKEKEI